MSETETAVLRRDMTAIIREAEVERGRANRAEALLREIADLWFSPSGPSVSGDHMLRLEQYRSEP